MRATPQSLLTLRARRSSRIPGSLVTRHAPLVLVALLVVACSSANAQNNGDTLQWNSTTLSSWTSGTGSGPWFDITTNAQVQLSTGAARNKNYLFLFSGTVTNGTVAPAAMTISGVTLYSTSITFQNGFNSTNTTSITNGSTTTASSLVLGSVNGSALTTATAWSLTDNASSGTVTFADGISPNLALTLKLFSSGTITAAAGSTIALSSAITDFDATHTGGITKAGAGILVLSGANTYSGGTTISAGTLQLSGSGTLGSTNGSLTVNSGILDLNGTTQGIGNLTGSGGTILNNATGTNVTLTIGNGNGAGGDYQGVIANNTSGTGTVALTKIGSGTITLSGANTYSGGTTLSAGTLQLGSSSTGSITNGPVGTGTLTLNGGTLSSNVGDFITTRSIANPITFGGDVTFGTNTNFGALSLSGAGTLTGNRTLTFVADVTYSGNIGQSGGSFGLTKAGSGTLKLSGVNSYSGGTTVNAGLLWLNSSSALGSSSASLTVNGGIVDLSGNNISVGNLTGAGGTIWNNLGPSNAVTLTIGNSNNGSGNYQGVIADNNGASAGTIALIKTGSGTITLSGANSYTGATTVNGGGALFINGNQSAATGAVTVNGSGTTLGGSGTIGGSVTISSGSGTNNNLSPGATGQGSVAKLSTGALTLNMATNFNIDITGAGGIGNAGITYDQLGVTGTVNLGGVLASNLVLNVSGLTQSNIGEKFFILLNDGTDLVSGTFAQGATITSGADVFTINYADNGDSGTLGNDISLTLIAVPEPSTWIGAALALVAIGITQRRRLAKRLRVTGRSPSLQ